MSSQSYDEFVDQYRAKLERLDNSGGTVETYLRVVQILFRLMDLHGVALADLTPDLAAQLVQRAADRDKQATYDTFIARRFVALSKTTPGRYRPDDTLLAFLEAL
jgi:hypothetical protein